MLNAYWSDRKRNNMRLKDAMFMEKSQKLLLNPVKLNPEIEYFLLPQLSVNKRSIILGQYVFAMCSINGDMIYMHYNLSDLMRLHHRGWFDCFRNFRSAGVYFHRICMVDSM